MLPVKFKEANKTLTEPQPNPTGMEILDLPTHTTKECVISCWRMSWRERFSALFFGRVWCHIMTCEETQPPIGLCAKLSYFLPYRRETPVVFRWMAKAPVRLDSTTYRKHNIFVPQYPHMATERWPEEGPWQGHYLTAYGGCLYHFREHRLADEVAHEQGWHPRAHGQWCTLDEAAQIINATEEVNAD